MRGGDNINIKQFIVSSDFMRMAIKHGEEDRTVSDPVATQKLDKYVDALTKAKQFITPDIGTMTYDDPEGKYSYHGITINLLREEFEGNEITKLAEIINAFDSLMFYASSACDISIQLIIDGTYVTRETV